MIICIIFHHTYVTPNHYSFCYLASLCKEAFLLSDLKQQTEHKYLSPLSSLKTNLMFVYEMELLNGRGVSLYPYNRHVSIFPDCVWLLVRLCLDKVSSVFNHVELLPKFYGIKVTVFHIIVSILK